MDMRLEQRCMLMNEKEQSQRCPSKDGPPISTGPEVMGLPGIAACLNRLSAQHLGRRPQGQDAAVHKMANSELWSAL